MPLYAYRCGERRHEFETLARFDETPDCPACGGAQVERQLSRIAKPAASAESGEASCAALSGGAPCPACPVLTGA